MIVLDTSILVDGLTGHRASYPSLIRVFGSDEHLAVPALVFYEWFRGPRQTFEVDDLYHLFPAESIIPFGHEEAKLAALLYLSVSRPRSREFDLGIAACAIVRNAPLWTLNPRDFDDIPQLRLYALA